MLYDKNLVLDIASGWGYYWMDEENNLYFMET